MKTTSHPWSKLARIQKRINKQIIPQKRKKLLLNEAYSQIMAAAGGIDQALDHLEHCKTCESACNQTGAKRRPLKRKISQ